VIAALLALALRAAPAPAPAPPAPVRRALVVAYNGSDQPGTPDLRFADDDGLRDAEALSRLGVEVVLLTLPDAETAREGSAWLAQAQVPSPEALDRAVAELAAKNAQDRAHGRATEALVFYVGHGALDEAGRAYLTLQGGRLDRAGLYAQVVDRLGADRTHVIVDACNAAGVVGHRGPDGRVMAQLQGLLDDEKASARPTVGVLYAESDDGRTHEWSRLRSGVFSHLVRSGLLGAADVNGDGQVEYSELQAFVAASLLAVQDVRARLHIRAHPPESAPRGPLVGRAPPGPTLLLPAGSLATKLVVTDEQGLLLAELHRSVSTAVVLALPVREGYWLRTPEGEAHLGADPSKAPLPPLSPVEVSMRGPEEDSLSRGLFAVALDRSFYEGFAASAGLPAVDFEATSGGLPQAAPLDPARGPLGVELSLWGGLAPVGAGGGAGGVLAGYRLAPRAWGWRAGALLSWSVAPGAWQRGAGSLQRLAAVGVVGLQGGGVTPWAEVGAGYLAVLANGPAGWSGDSLAGTVRVAGGVLPEVGGVRVRFTLSVDVDSARVDGARQVFFRPGAAVGVEF
jgi:hypothetical protein